MNYKIKDLDKIANTIYKKLIYPNVVFFYGDLGSGKTTLIKKIIKLLGVKKNIFSPTFLIRKSYEIKKNNLIHYDLYRLKKYSELVEIGFEEDIQNNNAIVFIEWPEKINQLDKNIKKINPKNKITKIYLKHTYNINTRNIMISNE